MERNDSLGPKQENTVQETSVMMDIEEIGKGEVERKEQDFIVEEGGQE